MHKGAINLIRNLSIKLTFPLLFNALYHYEYNRFRTLQLIIIPGQLPGHIHVTTPLFPAAFALFNPTKHFNPYISQTTLKLTVHTVSTIALTSQISNLQQPYLLEIIANKHKF